MFRLPLFALLLLATSAMSTPNIVVSIAPIHSLVSGITEGITKPKLLLTNNQSAHHAHLVPSQLRLIEQADLIITIHPKFEKGLVKSLNRIDNSKIFIVNSDLNNHHTWLSISRMQDFIKQLTNRLIMLDENNSIAYKNNYLKLDKKLTTLKLNIQQTLANTNIPIANYSNALDYFIKDNQLNQTTIINSKHEERLSIYKIIKAKKSMYANNVVCLLSTTNVPIKRINTLTEGLNINTASLNIMGSETTLDINQYFKLMHNITNKVSQCLQ
jgi:zinc transport system substrate-binding protein